MSVAPRGRLDDRKRITYRARFGLQTINDEPLDAGIATTGLRRGDVLFTETCRDVHEIVRSREYDLHIRAINIYANSQSVLGRQLGANCSHYHEAAQAVHCAAGGCGPRTFV